MSTNLISGLSSGFDWQAMVTQLIAVDRQRTTLIANQKTVVEKKLGEWQSLNSRLLALKSAASGLKSADAFALYKATLGSDSATVKGADLLTVATTATATPGSYSVKVNRLATAQKLSSGAFAAATATLGADFAGDLLINGKVVTVAATDTLTNLRDKINNANSGATPTGVTASIISYGAGDHRLVLTSATTGAGGIGLANGGALDILGALGLTDTSRIAKHHLAGADQSDGFTSATTAIGTLLGLTGAQAAGAGQIVVNGQALAAIDLNTDTLESLATKFTAAGLTASVTAEESDGRTTYRLLVAGAANSFTDQNHILETLGLITAGVSDVMGVRGDTANTAGGQAITAATLLQEIDGYTGFQETDYILLEGTDTNGAAVSDATFTLSAATTVGDLLAKIQSLFGDVTATLDSQGRLTIVDDTPGASPLAVRVGVKNGGGTDEGTLLFDANGDLGAAVSLRKRELVAAADASLTIDGVAVTRAANTISDVIGGVTLNLLKADTGTTVSLTVGRDSDALVAKVNAFVTSYNAVAGYIRTQGSYDTTTKKTGGILFGDNTLASVKSDLTSLLVRGVWGVDSDFAILGQVGVSVNTQGQLTVNDSLLRGFLNTNFDDVQKLFAASGEASTGTLSYISHSRQTQQGQYAVHIQTAATRSASAPSDATSLSGDETLTIGEGGRSAVVALTAGMSMPQVVNAVNSELAAVRNQVLAGSALLYADAGQGAAITAATTWDNLYSDAGVSAGLADGDVIAFSGTGRSGAAVSGSYTIGDIAADTVQGLLTAIEAAFGNEVTAAVDATGRITVTDKTAGSSSLALSFDLSQAHALDLGTLAADNPGGQTGRTALAVTAAADAGGHLVLTHASYGSPYGFTIAQANNLLWSGGDQTVANGLDVAGTINGAAATGSGQILKLESEGAGGDGLAVKYTGTANDTAAGTVTLTLGIAELYERALFNITDTFDGYVTYKQESLKNSATNYQKQIDEQEMRLAAKQERMINRFVKMELALQQIQSQSNWLAGQTTAAAKGWWS